MTGFVVDRCGGGEQSAVVDGIVFVYVDLCRGLELFLAENGFGRPGTITKAFDDWPRPAAKKKSLCRQFFL